jgi:hypothetical protein
MAGSTVYKGRLAPQVHGKKTRSYLQCFQRNHNRTHPLKGQLFLLDLSFLFPKEVSVKKQKTDLAMEQIKYRYSALYEEIIDYPELGRFRRYTEEWTWILYDGSAEIRRLRQECDDMIATIQRQANRTTVFTVTDVHQNDICKEHPELSLKMDEYKEKIRQYSK